LAFNLKPILNNMSAGCVSYSSPFGKTCGLGASWVKTGVFDFQTPKYGISLYVGVVGSEYDYFDRKAFYDVELGYHYFFNGINNLGLNLGYTIVAGNENDGNGYKWYVLGRLSILNIINKNKLRV
jgi:hypothetical protein